VPELRTNQRALIDHVLLRLGALGPATNAPMPTMELRDLQAAGLATGLTSLIAHLHLGHADDLNDPRDPRGGDTPGALDAEVVTWLIEQRDQVAQRVDAFTALVPTLRRTLADADIVAVPVKGAELINGIWAIPSARPMADIDLIIPPRYRAQAAAALQRSGLTLHSSTASEDAFLAWGDGSVGRTDGESAAHNGRVELHPGWSERLHGYTVRGFDIERHATADSEFAGGWRLPQPALTTHVIGHLASTVVRAEVRAVNVVDVWFLHQHGIEWDVIEKLVGEIDPRLTGPGLWLVEQLIPGVVPNGVVDTQLRRLPTAAGQLLRSTDPNDVLRDPAQRTTARWRSTFAFGRERFAIADQMIWPTGRRGVRPFVEHVRRRLSR
jgi:Uncharacterised nucleotidyltransferase